MLLNDREISALHNWEMQRKWIEDRLAELRATGRKKNRSGLARELGIAASGVTRLISGNRRLQANEHRRVADYLEWPVETIRALEEGDLDIPL